MSFLKKKFGHPNYQTTCTFHLKNGPTFSFTDPVGEGGEDARLPEDVLGQEDPGVDRES